MCLACWKAYKQSRLDGEVLIIPITFGGASPVEFQYIHNPIAHGPFHDHFGGDDHSQCAPSESSKTNKSQHLTQWALGCIPSQKMSGICPK